MPIPRVCVSVASPGRRRSYTRFALPIAGVMLAACGSPPTAPSSGFPAAAPPATASTSAASATAADTIKINQGTLAFQSRVPGPVSLRGSHGFRFDGSIISGLEPSVICSAFDSCQPGTTVPIALNWTGTDIPGRARLQGQDFQVGSADSASLSIDLVSSFVAPAHVTETVSVTVPFTSSGLLGRVDGSPTLSLSGGGNVTFTLTWQQTPIEGWGMSYTSFDFGNGGGPN
jgi:hypothetical protein